MDTKLYTHYLNLMRSELMPAMGCTEPIAVAYAAARCAHELGGKPEHISVACSSNIIKNVKSVLVPNSGGMKGIEPAAALGAFGGDHTRRLEVLASMTEAARREAQAFLDSGKCDVEVLPGSGLLHVIVTVEKGSDKVAVEIRDSHTNIVSIVKNGENIYQNGNASRSGDSDSNVAMSVDSILEFARTVSLDDVQELLERQISLNTAISEEGLANTWGATIGRILAKHGPDTIANKARAAAAAASDARMSGCDKAVVINSGSGNQGATTSLPVIEYARHLGASHEKLLRALVISNLVALFEKSLIGKLSAYCGVVSAASGSGAAITYLEGGSDEMIKDTIINTLAITSGMICDGAKASCAAKIAVAVDSAILGHTMAMEGVRFDSGDGIVKDDADATVCMVGKLASQGMRETDNVILDIMLNR